VGWRGVRVTYLYWLVCGLWILAGFAGCSGGGGGGSNGGGGQGTTTPGSTTQSGEVRVTLSDPPICKAPQSDLNHVFVTITLVRAHLSSTADPDDSGWVNLVDLRSNPQQIDLLSTPDTTCVLTTLGSTTGLPSGAYQQIRLHLLSNTPAQGEATPLPNACAGTGGFNCVVLMNGTRQLLRLNSEAQTGIKIPPGQIAGGAIRLTAGQAADMNIDFDACRSIVLQGNGAFRLKPTVRAGQVSLTTQAISGRVVDQSTGQPIPNATIIVMAEQPDTDGIDRVVLQTLASPTQGTFSLCPLPTGNYDIVIAALSATSVTYHTTITFGVSAGTAIGTIPLVRGGNTAPGVITGQVTTDGGATGADIALSALQTAEPTGFAPIQVTIPLVAESATNVATERTSGSACPEGTACATYVLTVPASLPLVGTFSAAGTTYAGPAGGDVLYNVSAQAFLPGTAGTPDCVPASLVTSPVGVSAGAVSQAGTLAFTACTAGP
jgi:uncharacterized protein DUF4382/carboxypeptidase family protein